MTQPDQGLRARLAGLYQRRHESPEERAEFLGCLYEAYSTDQLITLSDHEAAVKAAVDAERESIAAYIANHGLECGHDGNPQWLAEWSHSLTHVQCLAIAAAIRARANVGE